MHIFSSTKFINVDMNDTLVDILQLFPLVFHIELPKTQACVVLSYLKGQMYVSL